MSPFEWMWWRLAWSRTNRGGTITVGLDGNFLRWDYVAFGFWWMRRPEGGR